VYEAWAVNGTGESRVSVRTTAWAYDTPAAPTGVTAAPQPNGNEGNMVALSITGIDAEETGKLVIASSSGETREMSVRTNQDSLDVPSFRVGSNSLTNVTVTPVSRFTPPPGLGGEVGGQPKVIQANGVGAPIGINLALTSRSDGNGTATVTATVSAQANGAGSHVQYGIARSGRGGEQCRPADGGQTRTFTGLEEGEEHSFVACAVSTYGGRTFGSVDTQSQIRVQTTKAPTGWTFAVDRNPQVNGQRAQWNIEEPRSNDRVPSNYRPLITGYPATEYNREPTIMVQYVRDGWEPSAAVRVEAANAPYQVAIEWAVTRCVGGEQLAVSKTSSGPGEVRAQTDSLLISYRDERGRPLIPTEAGVVPKGTVEVRGIPVTASVGQWGLNNTSGATASYASCTPNLDPVEPPVPDPNEPADSNPAPNP
jgi:hypothetical protein